MNKLYFNQIGCNRFDVLLEVPLENKWYDNVVLSCFNYKDSFDFKLEHISNDNDVIRFGNIVELPDSPLYNTYVSCNIDGVLYYLDKKGNFVSEIKKSEMKKQDVNFYVPEWGKGTGIYYIFVDRFYRSDESKLINIPGRNIHYDLSEGPQLGPDENGIWCNDFYGGDLKGITEKLHYIRNMGISILYIGPVVLSPTNHRYDTSDYSKIDFFAGKMEDLRELCDIAHGLGMKIILDGVFNHTSNDSKYFNEYGTYGDDGAFRNPNSKYQKFYKNRYDNEGNITSEFSYWWGFKTLPECDSDSLEWQDFICGVGGVIDQWFECGIDGLRLDVADELSDDFIECIRYACERNKKEIFIYGEVWEQDIYQHRSYLMSGRGMHSVMNYKGMNGLLKYYMFGNTNFFKNTYEEIIGEYPKASRDSLMNLTSTHDMSRIISLFGAPYLFSHNNNDNMLDWAWNIDNSQHNFIKNFQLTEEEYKLGRARYLSYALSLGFLPGNFSICYGDEAGVQGLGNLDNRKYFPWNNIDYTIHNHISKIGNIREKNLFLREAEVDLLELNDKYIMFERYDEKTGESMLICSNVTGEEVKIVIPNQYNNQIYSLERADSKTLTPYGGIVLKKELKKY